MVKCSKCNSENDADAVYCRDCGSKLNRNPYDLDGKNREYASTSGISSGSHDAYYKHSADSANSNSNSKSKSKFNLKFDFNRPDSDSKFNLDFNINQKPNSRFSKIIGYFNGMSNGKKFASCCCAVFLILFLFVLLTNMMPQPIAYNENLPANHDYSAIDLDKDGALNSSELSSQYNNMTAMEIDKLFYKGDENKNKIIKGQEYDHFLYQVDIFFEEKEKKRLAEEQKAKREQEKALKNASKNSSSSKSSKNPAYGYNGICIYCGSDQYSRSSDGMGNFECDDCGSYLYWSDIIKMDDLRCPSCNGKVTTTNGDKYKCKNCCKSWNYVKLKVV